MENILSHVPPSRGKGVLIELSPSAGQSPTRSIYERNKSNITSDSGIYDYVTTASSRLETNSPSWRNNVSTSVDDNTTGMQDNGVYIASTASGSGSPYTRRQQMTNVELSTSEPINQQRQQRTVQRQIASSSSMGYENSGNYRQGLDTQGKVPITSQSRLIKPLVVDEIETIETETRVECQVQRTRETNESTTTDRIVNPSGSPKKIITTTTTHSTHNLIDDKVPLKRVYIRERPPYCEGTNRSSLQDNEGSIRMERDRLFNAPRSYSTDPPGLKVTSLSSEAQIKFDRNPSHEVIATVRVPELANGRSTSSSIIRHEINESERIARNKSEGEHYQQVHATNYHSTPALHSYPQKSTRSRIGSTAPTNTYSSPINISINSASHQSSSHGQRPQRSHTPDAGLTLRSQTQHHSRSLDNLFGPTIDFEIEIEKRPRQQPEQPTVVSLDQNSRAIVTTSKDGRVSIQNIAARPGNTVVINSDFHSSDRSLNRSSGYFSSDEIRSQGQHTPYSSDEQSINTNQSPFSTSVRAPRYQNEQNYHFNQVNDIVHQYSQPCIHSLGFNEAIDQIDALYQNLDVKVNDRPYDFSKPTATTTATANRRKQLTKSPNSYTTRYMSTGFQHIPHDPQTPSAFHYTNNNQNWAPTSLTNLAMATPVRPIEPLSSSDAAADYGTPSANNPNSGYNSIQNLITHQNRLNGQSQIVQRNRTSVKQVKQKNAARKRIGSVPGLYSDEDEGNDSPLSDDGLLQPHLRPPSRSYNFNNHRTYT